MWQVYVGSTSTRWHVKGSPSPQEILQRYGGKNSTPRRARCNGSPRGKGIREWCHLLAQWGIPGSESSKRQQWLEVLRLQVIFISSMPSYCYLCPADFSSGESLSHVRFFATPWTAASQASLCITNTQSLLKLLSIESVMPSNPLSLCHPLLLPPSIFPSSRVFTNESALCIRWPKYWSFSFNISPFNEHSGLISFRMDWLDLLATQGTLKSLHQHHSSKASIHRHSAFYIVQLSIPYMTTGKTIALTRQTFVGKVMSLLFNFLMSRLVITFLPRNKCLFISWLQSPSAVIWEPPKRKSVTVSTVSPSIYHEVMGPDAMIVFFRMLSLSQLFHSPLSLSSRNSLVLLHFLP